MFLSVGHDENISLLLLRLGLVFRMKYFSAMLRMHLFVAAEYGCILSITQPQQMQPMHSREIFHSKNQTKPQQKENILTVPPQKETFTTKLPVARKRKKKKTQHKVGTATEDTSVIPEERGGQETPLSSSRNTSVI